MRATVSGPCALQRGCLHVVKRYWVSWGGSTLGGTGGVVGTGCTMEERVAVHIVGVVEVALGSVAAAAPPVLVAAARVVDDADSDVHIAEAVGKAFPVAGLAGGASARRAAAHDLAAVVRT